MKTDFKAYKEYLDERVKCHPHINEMIDFYKGLIDIWGNAQPDNLSALFSAERLSKGLYMLDEEKIEDVDFTNSAETARRIFRLLEQQKKGETTAVDGLSGGDITDFIKDGLYKEDRFNNAVLKWILKPSFNAMKETLHSLFEKGGSGRIWNAGRCPVCYSLPGMALVDAMTLGTELNSVPKEQRFLSCCFCGYLWLFDRVACPACGDNRPEKHGFFVGEAGCEQGTRAISCEGCKTYVKTVFIGCRDDGKGVMDLDMDIEDVATLPLDIVANQRGYRALCQS